MMTPEQAKATLDGLRNTGWVEQSLGRSQGLKGRAREAARTLLENAALSDEWHGRLRLALGQLEAHERVAMLEMLFPGRSGVVEHGWRMHEHLPYQVGWSRKAFRAPGCADVLDPRRSEWLLDVSWLLGPYADQKLSWLAAWGSHITSHYFAPDELGTLLAAALDAGGPEGEEVFEVLRASARGEHEVGTMGRHVTRALLSASRPDGWEVVERLLLAAQREEGLRQVILETADEAHPEAFRRMLRLIVAHGLVRFSSVVRALNVWLGYQWDSVSAGVVNRTIEKLLLFLDDAQAREAALVGDDAEAVYLALWATAYDDAPAALQPARALLSHPRVEHRYVGAHFLSQLRLPAADDALRDALEDADLRVSARALMHWRLSAEQRTSDTGLLRGALERAGDTDLFERLERQVARYPAKRTTLEPLVWPWTATAVDRAGVAGTLEEALGARSPVRLVPHLKSMDVWARVHAVSLLGAAWERKNLAARGALLDLVGDGSQHVRASAMGALGDTGLAPDEAPRLEGLLARNPGDIRSGALTLLLRQPDEAALASADRLLSSSLAPQRIGGLDLLRQLVEAGRAVAECRGRAEAYQASRPVHGDAERRSLEIILAADAVVPSLADALGLAPTAARTWPPAPVARQVALRSETTPRLIAALEEVLEAHREDIVTVQRWDGSAYTGPFGSVSLAAPDPVRPAEEDRARFTLGEVWEAWWQGRGPELRDPDGMETARAMVVALGGRQVSLGSERMRKLFPEQCRVVLGDSDSPAAPTLLAVLRWMVKLHPPAGAVDFILDAAETALTMVDPAWCVVTEADRSRQEEYYRNFSVLPPRSLEWRGTSPFTLWLHVADTFHTHAPQLWTPEQHARAWRLWRWLDEPRRPPSAGGERLPEGAALLPRHAPPLWLMCRAREANGATDADVYDLLVGERSEDNGRCHFGSLRQLTRPRARELACNPSLRPLVERTRERILEVELSRGDTPTAASAAALVVQSLYGAETLVGILRALGKRQFRRGFHYDSLSAETVFSHLARRCLPRESDTPAGFAGLARKARIPERRLVELAVYAPQWAPFVEHALAWKGLGDGAWWIHAHTKGTDWNVDAEIRELWKADLSSRTPLDGQDLLDGAVDVAWFHRAYGALKARRWGELYDAAKYACSGAGHARARLFADAMLSDVSRKELVALVRQKRNQDAVRSVGLLPLAKGARRQADVLERYHVIQEFLRGCRQFGSQRQASEKRAAQVGLDNLARTAGYADPIRLQWAMEAKAIEDLAEGPIALTVEGVEFSLGIDPWGDVDLRVTKDGKTLADVPGKLKKNADVARLRTRKVELKRQASRIRPSLEQLMIRGETLSGAELRELLGHPLLGPMLKALVLVGDGLAGYPVEGGKALEDHAGKLHGVTAKDVLRIAHPLDLLPAASWSRWQKDCFARERIQPFKQVFREFYPLTANEKREGEGTSRYAGHQVQPRQAIALLGQRGWVSHPEEGVRKTFHDAGLIAWLEFEEGFFTPAEVEGLTLDVVRFTRRADRRTVPLGDVPPRLFSEAMRDLDLVVSVAHRGGVDPEASASTMDMRAALVEQASGLLKLRNVRVKPPVVLVDGELGRYTVHLGSAVTRKLPGETLFIVAVHSQHRGRLFLPFADDDPRSAEVLSKVLLLSRDGEIKDPTILEQLRG